MSLKHNFEIYLVILEKAKTDFIFHFQFDSLNSLSLTNIDKGMLFLHPMLLFF